jgi:hypothetical protein
MATFGFAPVFNFWQFTGLNTLNQVGQLATLTELGRVTSLSAFFGGHTAAVNARLVIWDSSGNILGQSATFSAAKGTASTGGQALQSQSITPLLLAAANYYVGFWRDAAGDAEWSSNNGAGTWNDNTDLTGAPSAFTGLTNNAGTIEVFATYTPIRIYVRRSGAWVALALRTRRSGAWSIPAVSVRRSGTWSPVQRVERLEWSESGRILLPTGWERCVIVTGDERQLRPAA